MIPQNRNQAYSLLMAVEGDLERLSQEQIAAIRKLYGLNDDHSPSEVPP
jgi:hypothetical protein